MQKLLGNILLVGVATIVLMTALGMMRTPPATGQLAHSSSSLASHVIHPVIRISQLDPAQYASPQEAETWSGSTCSVASMVEVMDAYGRAYHITDVLAVAVQVHAITPELGLLDNRGIARTVLHFGFQANWGYQQTLDQVIAVANQGEPVIVNFPPQPGPFPSGHFLVVIGSDQTQVNLADSSSYNLTTLSRARFLALWRGFSAVVVPQQQGGH